MYLTSLGHPTDITVGQGLLSLQQLRVKGECFYFFCSFTFIHFPFSPVPLSSPLLSLLSSPFLWETTQNDPQVLTFLLNTNSINQSTSLRGTQIFKIPERST